jgi:hypothetical protein
MSRQKSVIRSDQACTGPVKACTETSFLRLLPDKPDPAGEEGPESRIYMRPSRTSALRPLFQTAAKKRSSSFRAFFFPLLYFSLRCFIFTSFSFHVHFTVILPSAAHF